MSLTKALLRYRTGTLNLMSSRELTQLQETVIDKIDELKTIIRTHRVAPEIYDDLRQYGAIRDEIARLLEARTDASGKVTEQAVLA